MKDNVGVLLPVFSLPGSYGIGDFGQCCYSFINWLKKNNFKYWQILPLNPIGPGNSPYMSICSNAIEYRYISIENIEGFIFNEEEAKTATNKVNYQYSGKIKEKALHQAYISFFNEEYKSKLDKFIRSNEWVKNYAIFQILSKKNKNAYWNNWTKGDIEYLKRYKSVQEKYLPEFYYYVFEQYIAYKQWKNVLKYANKNGIQIISDTPFYVGVNSVECWSNPKLFKFDENYQQTEVGGVPPDYFNEEGQLWGSPIYNFDLMKKNNYKWFISRIEYQLKLCNILRIDHFRAFDSYYVIPLGETAKHGKWVDGPSYDFFDEFFKHLPTANIIAEDLGSNLDRVHKLRNHYHIPGMYVAQFDFFNYEKWGGENQIVYTGTHDNDTLKDWYKSLDENQINVIKDRTQCFDNPFIGLIDVILNKMPSKITIIPLQDLLGLDNKSRINVPGTMKNNWKWKLKDNSWSKL